MKKNKNNNNNNFEENEIKKELKGKMFLLDVVFGNIFIGYGH